MPPKAASRKRRSPNDESVETVDLLGGAAVKTVLPPISTKISTAYGSPIESAPIRKRQRTNFTLKDVINDLVEDATTSIEGRGSSSPSLRPTQPQAEASSSSQHLEVPSRAGSRRARKRRSPRPSPTPEPTPRPSHSPEPDFGPLNESDDELAGPATSPVRPLANETPKKAKDAEKKAREAEQKAKDADKQAKDAEKRAKDAERKTKDAEKKAKDAERKAKEAEKEATNENPSQKQATSPKRPRVATAEQEEAQLPPAKKPRTSGSPPSPKEAHLRVPPDGTPPSGPRQHTSEPASPDELSTRSRKSQTSIEPQQVPGSSAATTQRTWTVGETGSLLRGGRMIDPSASSSQPSRVVTRSTAGTAARSLFSSADPSKPANPFTHLDPSQAPLVVAGGQPLRPNLLENRISTPHAGLARPVAGGPVASSSPRAPDTPTPAPSLRSGRQPFQANTPSALAYPPLSNVSGTNLPPATTQRNPDDDEPSSTSDEFSEDEPKLPPRRPSFHSVSSSSSSDESQKSRSRLPPVPTKPLPDIRPQDRQNNAPGKKHVTFSTIGGPTVQTDSFPAGYHATNGATRRPDTPRPPRFPLPVEESDEDSEDSEDEEEIAGSRLATRGRSENTQPKHLASIGSSAPATKGPATRNPPPTQAVKPQAAVTNLEAKKQASNVLSSVSATEPKGSIQDLPRKGPRVPKTPQQPSQPADESNTLTLRGREVQRGPVENRLQRSIDYVRQKLTPQRRERKDKRDDGSDGSGSPGRGDGFGKRAKDSASRVGSWFSDLWQWLVSLFWAVLSYRPGNWIWAVIGVSAIIVWLGLPSHHTLKPPSISRLIPLWVENPRTILSSPEIYDIQDQLRTLGHELDLAGRVDKAHKDSLDVLEAIVPKMVQMRVDREGHLKIQTGFFEALKDLILNDRDIFTLNRDAGGKPFISEPHYAAVKARLDSDPTGVGLSGVEVYSMIEEKSPESWVAWVQQNNEQVRRTLENAGLTDAVSEKVISQLGSTKIPSIVTREQFLAELKEEFRINNGQIRSDMAAFFEQSGRAQVEQFIEEALQTGPSAGKTREDITRLVDDRIRTLLGRAGLSALADSKLNGFLEADLAKRVNFFSRGSGALIDVVKTSPDYETPPSPFDFLSKQWKTMHQPKGEKPFVALQRWDDLGECWCGSVTETRFNQPNGVSLSIMMPHQIEPEYVVVEYIPPSRSLDPESAPKDIEVWAHIEDEVQRERVTDVSVTQLNPDGAQPWGKEDVQIGAFRYEPENANGGVQIYRIPEAIQDTGLVTDHITLRAMTNYGAENYTCFYRVRMYGTKVEEKL